MTDEFERSTRKNRFEKKRSSTKAITWLSVIGIVLIIVIISMIIFGGDEKANTNNSDRDSKLEIEEVDEPENKTSEEDQSTNELEVVEQEKTEDNSEEKEMEEEESDPAEVESDDPNVERAFKNSWQPVGTSQSEPHTTSYDKESVDWQEMSNAVEQALGIAPENQITWCRERAGDNKVKATVSPRSKQGETYRVYLEWVENQGWKPTLVENLIENDKKNSC